MDERAQTGWELWGDLLVLDMGGGQDGLRKERMEDVAPGGAPFRQVERGGGGKVDQKLPRWA